MKKGRFIINRAALTAIEKMKTDDGFPLLRPFTQAEGGIGYQLVGYPVDWTDAADKKVNQIHQYYILVIFLLSKFKKLLER